MCTALLHPFAVVYDAELAHRFLGACGAMRAAQKALSEEAIKAEWESITAVKMESEKSIYATLQGFFRAQEEDVQDRLQQQFLLYGSPNGTATSKAAPSTTMFDGLVDEDRWGVTLETLLDPVLVGVLEEGFLAGTRRIRIDVPNAFNPSERVREIASETAERTKGINMTTAAKLRESLLQGLEAGEDGDQLGQRVEHIFEQARGYRAVLIAHQVTAPVFNASQQEAYLAVGIKRNTWITQRDDRVRRRQRGPWDHWSADGQERLIDEPFIVSGEQLRFPGDPDGSPGNIMGCRCDVFPVVDGSGKDVQGAGKDVLDLSSMNARERSMVEVAVRERDIRQAYPELRDQHGQAKALQLLGKEYFVSESTVRSIVYEQRKVLG